MSDKPVILVVDDDPDFVEATKLILEKGGYDVDVAYDGKEGLEKVKSIKPSAIVLDVMMPEKDGYAVCAELKADPGYKEIPILLLTAVVSHISETHYTPRMGMETEADDYLDKPADPKEILKRIGNLLGR